MGKTTDEVEGTIVLQLQFNNYIGAPIQPISVKTTSIEQPELVYTITTNPSGMGIGLRDGRSYGGLASVVNNTMQLISQSVQGSTIDSIYHFRLIELETSEKTYTKFKFID